MTPNADRYNPAPAYLRQLLKAAGINQVDAAECLGLSDRAMRNYVSETDQREAPYTVQFALEALAAAGAVPPAAVQADPVMTSEWFEWREITEADVIDQAPPGLEYDAALRAVIKKVGDRFDRLPEFMRKGRPVGRWPVEAIEPDRFKLVMTVIAALDEQFRQRVQRRLSELWRSAAHQTYPLHRLLALRRLDALLEEWNDAGGLGWDDYAEHIGRVGRLEDKARDELAEQAVRHDPAVIPWAYSPLPETSVPELPAYRPGENNSAYRQIGAADAEVTARRLEREAEQLEHKAETWRKNAEMLRLAHGGPVVTAAALEAVTHNV